MHVPIIQLFSNTCSNNKVVLHAPVEYNVAKEVRLENIILIEKDSVILLRADCEISCPGSIRKENQIWDVDDFPTKEVLKE
jgi:hypothetical protein